MTTNADMMMKITGDATIALLMKVTRSPWTALDSGYTTIGSRKAYWKRGVYKNDLGKDAEMNHDALAKVKMPNRDGFIWIDAKKSH